jgi:hypothetical protein
VKEESISWLAIVVDKLSQEKRRVSVMTILSKQIPNIVLQNKLLAPTT